MLSYLIAGLIGAAAMFYLDPDRGKRRRALTRDRAAGTARRAGLLAGRTQRKIASGAYGVTQKVSHMEGRAPDLNDAALAQKVMSELFRDQRIPKGSLNINAQHGVVQIRGEVEHPEEINDIEQRVRRIAGVEDVENLLHLPGTEVRTS